MVIDVRAVLYHFITRTLFFLQFLQEDTIGRNAQTSGLSWVKPGTHEPFSKTTS